MVCNNEECNEYQAMLKEKIEQLELRCMALQMVNDNLTTALEDLNNK